MWFNSGLCVIDCVCVDNSRVWSLPERQGKVCRVPCTASESQVSLVMTPRKSVAAYAWLPVLALGICWSLAVDPLAILRMLYVHLGTQLNAITILGNR